jgi:hypothetical protein
MKRTMRLQQVDNDMPLIPKRHMLSDRLRLDSSTAYSCPLRRTTGIQIVFPLSWKSSTRRDSAAE